MCTRECVRETSASLLVASESHEQTRNSRRLDNRRGDTVSAKCSRARKSIQRRTRAKIAVFSDAKVMAACCTKECAESKFLSCVATVAIL